MTSSITASRRGFIKSTLAGVAAAASVPAFAASAPTPLPKKWDGEADVIVVGFGGAGAIRLPSRTSRAQRNASTTLTAPPIQSA